MGSALTKLSGINRLNFSGLHSFTLLFPTLTVSVAKFLMLCCLHDLCQKKQHIYHEYLSASHKAFQLVPRSNCFVATCYPSGSSLFKPIWRLCLLHFKQVSFPKCLWTKTAAAFMEKSAIKVSFLRRIPQCTWCTDVWIGKKNKLSLSLVNISLLFELGKCFELKWGKLLRLPKYLQQISDTALWKFQWGPSSLGLPAGSSTNGFLSNQPLAFLIPIFLKKRTQPNQPLEVFIVSAVLSNCPSV